MRAAPARREMMKVLAGDVGGTKTLLAVVERGAAGMRLLHEQRFESAAYPGLAPIVAEFLAATGAAVESACFGVPGAVVGGECHTPNLPWVIRGADLAAVIGTDRALLINDFAAAALGVLALGPESLATLQQGCHAEHGTKAILGAGTGLGEALLVWNGHRYNVVPTEGGHADFAPQGDEQRAMQCHLEERHRGRVSVERVVSGPGIARIHEFLVAQGAPVSPAVREAMAGEDATAVISRFGMAGTDAGCAHALDLFVAAYGAEAGNLALRSLPTGGVYIAGGVAPKIRPRLEDGAFMAAFRAKGRMRELMATFPVHLVLEARVGLLGAALEALAGQLSGLV
jgi:glucokinase